jgi:pimeloyl-ACP methyl ester carboxylesterase
MDKRAVQVVARLVAVLLLVSVLTSLVSCRAKERSVRRSVPSPILFVHGLGGSAQTWNEAGLTAYLQSKRLRYGGVVQIYNGGQAAIKESPDADFFLVEIAPSSQSLQKWEEALAKAIAAVREETGSSRVVLVGHSAGGLAGRKYLVDHLYDHEVAKLVTIASPHRGSELALLSLFKRAFHDGASQGGVSGSVYRTLDERLSAYERGLGIPLNAPIFHDLLPEQLNPDLLALNRAPHPEDMEYACILAVGSPESIQWEELAQLDRGRFWENLRTKSMAILAFLNGMPSVRGDGAVLEASQDLRNVDFFRSRKRLVEKCIEVDVGHQGVNEQHRAIVNSIESKVHFLRARRVASPGAVSTQVEVDFHDYFAGLSDIKATGALRPLPVSQPVIMQEEAGESFGRVTIGPFNSSVISRVDLVIRSLDGQRRFGKSILLHAKPGDELPKHAKPRPVAVTLAQVEGIPRERPSGLPWDPDFSPPNIQVTLSINRHEVFRSRIYEDAEGTVSLGESVALPEDPWDSEVVLEVWHVGVLREAVGRIVWSPGDFPRHSTAVEMSHSLTARMEVSGTDEDLIYRDDEPLVVASSR